MKSFTFYILTLFVACASAFAPIANKPAVFTHLAASKGPEPINEVLQNKNAAVLAAFATAVAPIAAQAAEIDQGVVIGYGAGLVACVVSLAVGFAIGYGTLVKP